MKTIAASIALSAFAATGVEAQEERRRFAPPAVYSVAPGLGHFTDEVLFGEIWERAELAPRDRSVVTLSAIVSTGKTAQIAAHVSRAMDNGVKPAEIGELITHLAFYSGRPNAISAVSEVKTVFDERGIAPLGDSESARIELEAEAEAAPDRSLVTMAALIAVGQPEQLPFNAKRAMDSGLTPSEASEVLAHVAFYAGWPRAMSAVPASSRLSKTGKELT